MRGFSSVPWNKADELFGIDLRSLALFRIGLGILIIYDLAIRATYLRAHYTDGGILPRSVLLEEYPRLFHLSFHLLSGDVIFQSILFIITAILTLLFIVGYYTRTSTLLLCILILSLHVRNPIILNSGDHILFLLLFWSCFLPLGSHISIDSGSFALNRNQKVFSIPSLCILLQISFVYLFTFLLKCHPIWTDEGTAVYFALSLDRFATPLGLWLRTLPHDILALLTHSTLVFEFVGPIISFVPIYNSYFRTLSSASFMIFHISLGIFMSLGIFPFVCIVAWTLFLPSELWDYIASNYNIKISYYQQIQGNKYINYISLVVIIYVSAFNVHSIDSSNGVLSDAIGPISKYGRVLNLNQKWSMFAPYPSKRDGWFVMIGHTKNGDRINLFNESRRNLFERPNVISYTYKNQRWRKFLGNRFLENKYDLSLFLIRYLLGRYNRLNPSGSHLQKISIYFMSERSSETNYSGPVNKRLIATKTVSSILQTADHQP